MSYEQFCSILQLRNQVFVLQDMPKHIQGTKAQITWLQNRTQRARHIFVSPSSNGLSLTMVRHMRRFHVYISKICHAQNGH